VFDAEAEPGWWSYPQLRIDLDDLDHNIATMARWCRDAEVDIFPHIKTTMCRSIVDRQLAAGAHGVTVATVDQAWTARSWGIRTIHLANQVVGDADRSLLLTMLSDDPGLRLQCFVDSHVGLDLLASTFAALPGRLEVLVDVGTVGGRAGVRDPAEARTLAAAVRGRPEVILAGVAAYEGVAPNRRDAATLASVDAHCRRAGAVFDSLRPIFAVPDPMFSIAGSAFPDRALAHRPSTPANVVLRSGCYVTHDHGTYAAVTPLPTLRPALSVAALVVSVPEPGLAVLGAGKRELPDDAGLPIPLPEPGADAHPGELTRLYDHHAVLRDHPSATVGQVVNLGISHPCSAFSRWDTVLAVRAGRVVDEWQTEFRRRPRRRHHQ
jgi:D-serine deaminase-like pyridoxal phosphate-dependent protein